MTLAVCAKSDLWVRGVGWQSLSWSPSEKDQNCFLILQGGKLKGGWVDQSTVSILYSVAEKDYKAKKKKKNRIIFSVN